MGTGHTRTKSYMTILLMIANVVIYLLTTYDKAFTSISDYWVSNAALIPVILLEPSEWYRFLTSMFLHGDIFHIFFNMYFLYLFGKEIEDVLGPGRFLTLYILSGLAASMFHIAFIPLTGIQGLFIPALGASGAISGVLGAYLLLFPRKKMSICWFSWIPFCFTTRAAYFLIFWFATQVLYGYSRLGGVAFFAHVGGFVAGMSFLALLVPTWVRELGVKVGLGTWGFGQYIIKRGLGNVSKWILTLLLVTLVGSALYVAIEGSGMGAGMYVYMIEAIMDGIRDSDIAVFDMRKIVVTPSSDAVRVALNRLYWAGILKGTPNTINDVYRYEGIVQTTIGGIPIKVKLYLTARVRYDKYGVLTELTGKMVTDVIQISALGGVRLERNVPISISLSAKGPTENIGTSLIVPAAILALLITLSSTYTVVSKDKELSLI